MTSTLKTAATPASRNDNTRRRLNPRKELLWATACIGFGLFIMPGLIYGVGVKILDAYGGGPNVGSFYGDFFRNLIAGTARTWFIAVGPYLILLAIRLIFWPWGAKLPTMQPGPDANVAHRPATKERREPFVAQ